MSTFEAVLAYDTRNFPRWLRALESVAKGRVIGFSKWYNGAGLQVYVRSHRAHPRYRGAPTLTIANIEVAEAFAGRGLLTAILQGIAAPESSLRAQYLIFESVMNVRLQAFLARKGFERTALALEFCPDYHRCIAGEAQEEIVA